MIKLEDAPCPLGCSKGDQVVCVGRDLLYGLPGEFLVVKCRECGLMRTNPRPTPDSIGFYYPEDYGPYVGTIIQEGENSSDKNLLGGAFVSWVKRIIDFRTTFLPPKKPGKMLEIGCASGGFLHQMKMQGWDVVGIEFSKAAAEAAIRRGYRVHAGPLETAPMLDGPYDLIVGWMVLEHLHDPIGGLRKLRKWAKPDTWLVVSVPNAGSLEFRIFKEKWYALHLPAHLFHFTPDSIKKVLAYSGWKVEKIYHQRTLANLIGSMGLYLRGKGYTKVGQKLVDFPEKTGWWPYAFYPLALMLGAIGQTGRMTIWAKPAE